MPKRKRLRENERRRPPWNASKADAKQHAKSREHANVVHGLESELKNQMVVIDNLTHLNLELRRMLDTVCDPKFMQALRQICAMSVRSAVDLGSIGAMTDLVQWSKVLEGGLIKNARLALDKANAASEPVKTIPNAEPLLPRPSGVIGVTKRTNDLDDPDSIDDLFAKAVDVHLERMDDNYYWLGLTPVGGQTVHVDIHAPLPKGRKMRARVRK